MILRLLCNVHPGIFNSEYAITFPDDENCLWNGFVDKELVTDVEGELGYINVILHKIKDGKGLVEFPVDGLPTKRVWIPISHTEFAREQ